jgi:hypothetical protein
MKRCGVVGVILLALAVVSLAPAWWVKGHESVAEAAASRLPEEMPAFFRAGGKHLAHFAGEPDRWKNPDAKFLRAAEAPDHYLDLEDLEGKALPSDRYQAAAQIARSKHRPERVGMLPYAILENYDRLSCAFKDFRDDPNNEAVRMKCLVYAGILSHFTGDAAMPLHTSRDYDGRKGPEGKLVQRGIHAKIDAFPEKNNLTAEEIARGLEPRKIDDVWAHVIKFIHESHTHVNKCYELDAAGAIDKPTPESREFILSRCRAGAQLTMDLWYSAWLRSEKMPAHY